MRHPSDGKTAKCKRMRQLSPHPASSSLVGTWFIGDQGRGEGLHYSRRQTWTPTYWSKEMTRSKKSPDSIIKSHNLVSFWLRRNFINVVKCGLYQILYKWSFLLIRHMLNMKFFFLCVHMMVSFCPSDVRGTWQVRYELASWPLVTGSQRMHVDAGSLIGLHPSVPECGLIWCPHKKNPNVLSQFPLSGNPATQTNKARPINQRHRYICFLQSAGALFMLNSYAGIWKMIILKIDDTRHFDIQAPHLL